MVNIKQFQKNDLEFLTQKTNISKLYDFKEKIQELIELFIKNGADVNAYDDIDGGNIINVAYDRGMYDIVEILKKHGASYDGKITENEQMMRDYALGMLESEKLRKK